MVSTRRSRKKTDAGSTTASPREEKSPVIEPIHEPENDQNNDRATDDTSEIDDDPSEQEGKKKSSLEDDEGNVDTLGKVESAATQQHPTTITTFTNTRKSKLQHSKVDPSEENELTKLVPGYTAPLRLDTTGLLNQPKGGLAQLRRQAERTDASTRSFVCGSRSHESEAVIKKKKNKIQSNGFMPSNYTTLLSRTSSFKSGHKQPAIDTTAGKGWFGMVPTPMTDELKTDLSILKNRNYLDPKRFYKKADRSSGSNRMMQVGTVIEGAAEFYSSRLAKKERRTNLTEEIMADPDAAGYTKRKYKSMQQAKSDAGRKRSRKFNQKGRKGY